MKVRITALSLIFLTLALMLWTVSAATTLTDLGTLDRPSWNYTVAFDINDRGEVVGESPSSSGETHAFLWAPATGMVDLGTFGGDFSTASGINNLGQVVGTIWRAGRWHAFLWTSESGMQDLGTLGGFSNAARINDLGQVIGSSQTAAGDVHGFIWTLDRGMVDLGTLGGTWSYTTGINSLGHIVGNSMNADGALRPFLWKPETGMVDLGYGGEYNSEAAGINDREQVVGRIYDGATARTILWTAGRIVDIGMLGDYGEPWSINNAGQVVGTSGIGLPYGYSHAFLWTESDGILDLGTLGGPISGATAINERGQIVGWAAAEDGWHAALWTVEAPSPQSTIKTMIGDVSALIRDGSLSAGQGNSLSQKLTHAAEQLDRGNTTAAANMLRAFVNELNGLIRAGKLTANQCEALLAAATQLITDLGR